MSSTNHARAVRELLDHEEVREVLRDTFYRAPVAVPRAEPIPEPRAQGVREESVLRPLASADTEPRRKLKRAKKTKPDHYDVICISLYKEDLERLDAKVAELKSRGHRRVTRSALIRHALDTIAMDALPKTL